MKGKLYAIVLPAIIALAITGCGKTDDYSQKDEIDNELDPARHEEYMDGEDQELNNKLGYVKYTSDQVKNEPAEDVKMDREKFADMITRNILKNEAFDEAATLVTDEDVLIAYQKNDALADERSAEIARKTATSVMPGYFDIYVSDNDVIMNDIQSLHNSTTQNKNYDNYKDEIINEMKKSPQGFGDHE